jgi:ATP-binding protein involved in chromosome partitioning
MKSYKDVVNEDSSIVARQVGEQERRVADRLASVRHIVAVTSGKGGVGKSTIAASLARVLAAGGRKVGLVDADINGPSIARMTGLGEQQVRMGETGMIPPTSVSGVKVMSVDLFLAGEKTPVVWEAPTQRDAYTWRGTMEAVAVREFFSDTEWGALDVLFVDLPPGSDKLPTLADVLPRLSGTLIVTIPSSVSRHVVGKSIQLIRDHLKTPVIGLVENMASYECPHCGAREHLFPSAAGDDWAKAFDVPFLGSIPFDPRFGEASDTAAGGLDPYTGLPAHRAINRLADEVVSYLEAS